MKKSISSMNMQELRVLAKNLGIPSSDTLSRLDLTRSFKSKKIDGIENGVPYEDVLLKSKRKNPKTINLERFELVVGVDSGYYPYLKLVPKKWIKKHDIDFQKLNAGFYPTTIMSEFAAFQDIDVTHYLNN